MATAYLLVKVARRDLRVVAAVVTRDRYLPTMAAHFWACVRQIDADTYETGEQLLRKACCQPVGEYRELACFLEPAGTSPS